MGSFSRRSLSSIVRISRRALKQLLRRWGYHIERVGSAQPDLRSTTEDPIEALYLSGGRPFLVDIPLDRLRGLGSLAFPCVRGTGHPLIETAWAYLQGDCFGYLGSPLEWFARAWAPPNAAAAMGLLGLDVSTGLINMPAYASVNVLPWGSVNPSELVSSRTLFEREENRLHGADLTVDEGSLFGGRLSVAKGELEFRRLTRVVESIRESGYLRSDEADGDIKGVILLRGNEWAVRVIQAEHRTAALAALGWSRAPVRICHNWWHKTNAVRCAEVDSWPNVRNGLFARAQALEIFDQIFEGRQPAGYPKVSSQFWLSQSTQNPQALTAHRESTEKTTLAVGAGATAFPACLSSREPDERTIALRLPIDTGECNHDT